MSHRVTFSSAILLFLACFTFIFTQGVAVQAQILATNNSGDGNSAYFISDEPTLVMNGFDLTALNLGLPVTVSSLTISVAQPVPGQAVTAVIYEDPNGGSPIDARLVSQFTTFLNTEGVINVVLPQAAVVNAPAMWAGFYLPIDFRGNADSSGSSVLTYMAWQPGGLLDLRNLAAATVLGPADGSQPVNINLGGIARINAILTTSAGRLIDDATPVPGVAVPGVQVDGGTANIAFLQSYAGCSDILFDGDDIGVSAGGAFSLHCRSNDPGMSSGLFANLGAVPPTIPSFERRGYFYEIYANGEFNAEAGNLAKLRVPVTHCVRPSAADLSTAVLAIAYGVPMAYEILPTVRYGEYICAELTHVGQFSYFVPRSGQETYINANLKLMGQAIINPSPASCRDNVGFGVSILNEGFAATPATLLRVQNIAVRTGQVTAQIDFAIASISPGKTVDYRDLTVVAPGFYYQEANRWVITIDPNGAIPEINEADNTITHTYILQENNLCGT